MGHFCANCLNTRWWWHYVPVRVGGLFLWGRAAAAGGGTWVGALGSARRRDAPDTARGALTPGVVRGGFGAKGFAPEVQAGRRRLEREGTQAPTPEAAVLPAAETKSKAGPGRARVPMDDTQTAAPPGASGGSGGSLREGLRPRPSAAPQVPRDAPRSSPRPRARAGRPARSGRETSTSLDRRSGARPHRNSGSGLEGKPESKGRPGRGPRACTPGKFLKDAGGRRKKSTQGEGWGPSDGAGAALARMQWRVWSRRRNADAEDPTPLGNRQLESRARSPAPELAFPTPLPLFPAQLAIHVSSDTTGVQDYAGRVPVGYRHLQNPWTVLPARGAAFPAPLRSPAQSPSTPTPMRRPAPSAAKPGAPRRPRPVSGRRSRTGHTGSRGRRPGLPPGTRLTVRRRGARGSFGRAGGPRRRHALAGAPGSERTGTARGRKGLIPRRRVGGGAGADREGRPRKPERDRHAVRERSRVVRAAPRAGTHRPVRRRQSRRGREACAEK